MPSQRCTMKSTLCLLSEGSMAASRCAVKRVMPQSIILGKRAQEEGKEEGHKRQESRRADGWTGKQIKHTCGRAASMWACWQGGACWRTVRRTNLIGYRVWGRSEGIWGGGEGARSEWPWPSLCDPDGSARSPSNQNVNRLSSRSRPCPGCACQLGSPSITCSPARAPRFSPLPCPS